jgi:hypothetical protein
MFILSSWWLYLAVATAFALYVLAAVPYGGFRAQRLLTVSFAFVMAASASLAASVWLGAAGDSK